MFFSFKYSLYKTSEYGFSLTRIFPYKDKIVVRENEKRSEEVRILTYFTQWLVLLFDETFFLY